MSAFNQFGLKFHHLGLASRREKDTIEFLTGLGYRIGESIYDGQQSVYVRLCKSEFSPDVEILVPSEVPGPLDGVLKSAETNLYHICYETVNLERSLELIHGSGIRTICISKPKIAVLFGGMKVSFYMIRGFGLVELLELKNVTADT